MELTKLCSLDVACSACEFAPPEAAPGTFAAAEICAVMSVRESDVSVAAGACSAPPASIQTRLLRLAAYADFPISMTLENGTRRQRFSD